MAREYYQGLFKPKNPRKYKGDVTNICFRSGYELKLMNWLDTTSEVLEWNSEETVIPYISPLDEKWHRYFVDFWVRTKSEIFLLEVKPSSQTAPPKQPKRKTQRYIREVMEWGKNEAKWKYATMYAEARGWKFKIVTEKDLAITS